MKFNIFFVVFVFAIFSLVLAGPIVDPEPTDEPTKKPTKVTITTTKTTEAPTESPTEPPTTRTPYHSHFKNLDCKLDDCNNSTCHCLSDMPPNGLSPDQIPQFILVTFDGAVTVTNFPQYQTLFQFKNPNNCPIHATYFVSHVDTNYKLTHELYRRGNEIAVHSVSKSKNNNQDYWKKLDYEGWKSEFGDQRKIISKYADIPIENIRGARAPNLQTAGNITFTALYDEEFEYDCSNPSRQGILSPFFPYTFDYGFQRMDDCQVQPCLKQGQVYPGFWDIPMNDWDVVYEIDNFTIHRECALASGCILFNPDGSINYEPTPQQIYDLFQYNFERFYNGNRAPFPLFLSEDWMHDGNKAQGLKRFIEDKLTKKDVFFVSMQEILDWMREPTNVDEYTAKTKECKQIPTTSCGLKDGEKIEDTTQFKRQCDFVKIGELNGLTKRMVICDDLNCPKNYPWINRIE